MTSGPPPRPIRNVPVAGAPSPTRHETILPPEQPGAVDALAGALGVADPGVRRRALQIVVAANPGFLDAWARLSELSLAEGDAVTAYACARVAYHRGLDRLRREGWGGTGMVRWARPSNRGFLRGLRALLAAAAAIGEAEESARCRDFLLELDPDDAIGAARYPAVPGPGWTPPPLPDR